MTPLWVVLVCTAGGAVSGFVIDTVASKVQRKPSSKTVELDTVGAASVPGPVPIPETLDVADEPAPVPVSPPGIAEGVAAIVVTGGLFALAAVRLGAVPELAAYCVLFAGLVAVSITDLRVGLVPRTYIYVTLALMTIGLVAASAVNSDWRSLLDAAIGGAIGFLVLGAVWWFYPKGMGFGDVRLAGLIGVGLAWLGFRQLYLGFLASFIVGALIGVVVMVAKGTGRKTRLPFAPALAVGAVFGVLWGGWLGDLWLHPG